MPTRFPKPIPPCVIRISVRYIQPNTTSHQRVHPSLRQTLRVITYAFHAPCGILKTDIYFMRRRNSFVHSSHVLCHFLWRASCYRCFASKYLIKTKIGLHVAKLVWHLLHDNICCAIFSVKRMIFMGRSVGNSFSHAWLERLWRHVVHSFMYPWRQGLLTS